jgi:hypothetical protein
MIRRASLVVALFVSACGSREPAREHTQLASLRFDVPAHWKRAEPSPSRLLANQAKSTVRGLEMAQWAPADNDRLESITIIRSERSPAVAKAGVSTLEQLLAHSQRSLRDVRASKATWLKTARGLAGARIDVDFTPPGTTDRYHRVHVVLADDTHGALVHVFYTARNPERNLTALSIVLNTIRYEEG